MLAPNSHTHWIYWSMLTPLKKEDSQVFKLFWSMLGSSPLLVKQINLNLPAPFFLKAENQHFRTSFF
ncbi:hypothetical protein DHD08_11815 [Arenibacter sp. H213]|nr:hypothetical protein [Arenibacter sp. H213]